MSQQTAVTSPSCDTSSSVSDNNELTDVAQVIDVSAATETPKELFCISKGRSLKCLVVLCVGLKDDNGVDLLDINKAPFSVFKKKDANPKSA
jgi:hypothetical protein